MAAVTNARVAVHDSRSLLARSHFAIHKPVMARDTTSPTSPDPMTGSLTNNLLFVLLALVLAASSCAVVLFFIRRHKQKRRDSLPLYKEVEQSSMSHTHHRRHSARLESDHVFQEKQRLMAESDRPRTPSPVPEIRVTLPEEVDSAGKSQSGRTVVVHVGEETVGFEPYNNRLPSYQQSESDRFQSLDLDRIGGLKEREHI